VNLLEPVKRVHHRLPELVKPVHHHRLELVKPFQHRALLKRVSLREPESSVVYLLKGSLEMAVQKHSKAML
jgi:hypothetical protein